MVITVMVITVMVITDVVVTDMVITDMVIAFRDRSSLEGSGAIGDIWAVVIVFALNHCQVYGSYIIKIR